jgi:hypothetical protein
MSKILGSGWGYPVQLDDRRQIALTTGEYDIEQAIFMILSTPKGQRVMRPEFGCQVHELVFDLNDANTAGLAEYYVKEALEMWEPRIIVQKVDARADPEDAGRLVIAIQYEIKATHDRRSLVYPFYRIPEE